MYGDINFQWNGISNTSLGLISVNINTNRNKEIFAGNRNLIVDKINDRNYLQGLEREPLKFTLELASEQPVTENRAEELARIFILDCYTNLICFDNTHVYHCISKSSEFNVYGNGYFLSLEMECSSPYSTSLWMGENYRLTETADIKINNKGSIPCYPIFELQPLNTGDTISIQNLTNGGKRFGIGTNGVIPLYNNETIKIDFDKNKLYVDLLKSLGSYRYNNISPDSEFFELVPGNNTLRISPCNIKIKYRYYYLT